jgi:very-short-patch-repair endonuclease
MSEILLSRAALWGGVFTTSDATAVGVSRNRLSALVRAGEVVKVGPRAYVLTSAQHAATTPERRHRLVTLAVLRSFGGRVAASHHSSLALHGLPFWRVDDTAIHVCRVAGRSSRVRGDLHVHESVSPRDLVTFRTTGALSTNATLAVIGTAVVDGVEAGIVAADAALKRKLTTLEDLEQALGAMRHTPKLGAAHQAVALADPLCESVGESRSRLVLRGLPGAPQVRSQHEIRDGRGNLVARVDFLVGDRVVVEFDGRVKYGMDGRRSEDDLWAEKRREDELRALGYIVVRVIWAHLERPDLVAQRVLTALRQAELPLRTPASH